MVGKHELSQGKFSVCWILFMVDEQYILSNALQLLNWLLPGAGTLRRNEQVAVAMERNQYLENAKPYSVWSTPYFEYSSSLYVSHVFFSVSTNRQTIATGKTNSWWLGIQDVDTTLVIPLLMGSLILLSFYRPLSDFSDLPGVWMKDLLLTGMVIKNMYGISVYGQYSWLHYCKDHQFWWGVTLPHYFVRVE